MTDILPYNKMMIKTFCFLTVIWATGTLMSCTSRSEKALEELGKRNIAYNATEFIRNAEEGNMEVIKLFLIAGMDPNVKDKILNSPWGKKTQNQKVPDVTVEDVRNLEPGISDDDLLIKIADPEGEFKDKLEVLIGSKQ